MICHVIFADWISAKRPLVLYKKQSSHWILELVQPPVSFWVSPISLKLYVKKPLHCLKIAIFNYSKWMLCININFKYSQEDLWGQNEGLEEMHLSLCLVLLTLSLDASAMSFCHEHFHCIRVFSFSLTLSCWKKKTTNISICCYASFWGIGFTKFLNNIYSHRICLNQKHLNCYPQTPFTY